MHSTSDYKILFSLALQAHKANRLPEAELLYRQYLNIFADNEASYMLGLLLAQKKSYPESIYFLERTFAQQKSNPELFNALAINYEKLSKFGSASHLIKKAIRLSPNKPHYRNRYCKILLQQQKYSQAKTVAENNISLNPDFIPAYISLSLAYSGLRQTLKALHTLKKASHIDPNNAEVLFNLAENYQSFRYFEKSELLYQTLIRRNYMVSECMTNQAVIEKERGEFSNSKLLLEHALKLKAGNLLALWNQCLLNLLQRNFSKAWRDYDLGLMLGLRKAFPTRSPTWQGEDLKNKSLLITREQGIGDEIMFCHAIPAISQNAGQISFVCSNRLKSIFERSFSNIHIINESEYKRIKKLKYDFQISAASVFQYITFPDSRFYHSKLTPDNSYLSANQRHQVKHSKKLKIGFAWRGGSELNDKLRRSTHVRHWRNLLNLSEYQFYCLQSGVSARDKKLLLKFSNSNLIIDEDIIIGQNLDMLLAYICEMDLVITVDNTITHLAAASHIPTWCLLNVSPDWRWGLDSSSSYWYPHIKLFRQKSLNNWQTVFEEVREKIRGFKKSY